MNFLKGDELIRLQDYYFLFQYPTLFILVLSHLAILKSIQLKNIVIFLALGLIAILSSLDVFGYFPSLNSRAILLPMIALIVLSTGSTRGFGILFSLNAVFMVIEYIFFFIFPGLISIDTRLGMPRPGGLFIDPALSSLFLCVGLLLLGHLRSAVLFAIILLNLQTLTIVLFLFLAVKLGKCHSLVYQRKVYSKIVIKDYIKTSSQTALSGKKNFPLSVTLRNYLAVFIVLLFWGVATQTVGHLDLSNEVSLISVYSDAFSQVGALQPLIPCLALGCYAKNVSELGLPAHLGDIGFIFQGLVLGFPFVFIYLFFFLINARSKYLVTGLALTLAHYAVIFGLLGAALTALLVNLSNSLSSTRTVRYQTFRNANVD